MFEAEEMEGCHSCKYGEDFDTEKEPCKYCYGLSMYTKSESEGKGMNVVIKNDALTVRTTMDARCFVSGIVLDNSCDNPEIIKAAKDFLARQSRLDDSLGKWRDKENEKPLSVMIVTDPRWIPVSEALPEENKAVMVSTEYSIYPEAQYSKEYGWEWAYESGADYWKKLEGVTAWMPLPEPYKETEE